MTESAAIVWGRHGRRFRRRAFVVWLAIACNLLGVAVLTYVCAGPASEGERHLTLPSPLQQLAALHERLGEPGANDWLSRYKEPGQTYIEYLQSSPNRATADRRTLYIQPLGDFSPTQQKIIDLTVEYMGIYFQLPVRVQKGLPLAVITERARRRHPEWGVPQILTGYVRDEVLKPRLPKDAVALIAFTASDLWPGEGWNFVFGEASLADRVGVWSIHRFGDPDAGPESYRLSLRRTLGTATHETGHMLSMQHCVFYLCSMCGSLTLPESDRYPLWLCPQCLAKLCDATGAEPRKRFQALIAFADANGLEKEAQFWKNSLLAISTESEKRPSSEQPPADGKTTPSRPDLPEGVGTLLKLRYWTWDGGKQRQESFKVSDAKTIGAILDVMREGTQQEDHKCASIGIAEITMRPGKTIEVELLPGHHRDWYEFRYQRKNYRVPRQALFAALGNAGLDTRLLPKGEVGE